MGFYDTLLHNLPQVAKPTEAKLGLKTKLKWTFIALLTYFILKHIYLWGLGAASLAQFEQLALLLGAEFGSLVSLGIGPIVTASIVLQLMNGSGLLKFDTSTHAGRAKFQGTQKLLAIFFILFESIIYVQMGGLSPDPIYAGTSLYGTLQWMLIFQLILGGMVILFLDDLTSKWGLGSGISLFIAASVSEQLFIQLFSFFANPNTPYMVGAIPSTIQALGGGDLQFVILNVAAIAATLGVFALVVYFQSMKVEVPLSFGRVRGYGMRWPLNFLYTSNIPVILIAALLAQIQLFSALLGDRFGWNAALIQQWVSPPQLVPQIISLGSLNIGSLLYVQAIVYSIILMLGAMMFAYFWMQTSGMDARSQAKQIMNSGLQIPGFRKDPRIIEHVLTRYIVPLTIMGGLTVGLLAALADVSGALVSGTGLLLAVMIIYKLYEDIAKQHMADMNPMMRKFMGGK